MKFNVTLFLSALGLAFILEALPWLLAPRKMKEVLCRLMELPGEKLRWWGGFLLVMGLVLVRLAM